MLYFKTEPTDQAVGFTAYFTDGHVLYDSNDIIIFDLVESNVGGYYQTSSSQFICPVHGLYAFSLHVLSGLWDVFAGQVMNESSLLGSVYGDGRDGFQNGGSNLVVTVCNKGDRVWVRSQSDRNLIYGDADRECTFSGFLVYEI